MKKDRKFLCGKCGDKAKLIFEQEEPYLLIFKCYKCSNQTAWIRED